jgi:hypothetical protein
MKNTKDRDEEIRKLLELGVCPDEEMAKAILECADEIDELSTMIATAIENKQARSVFGAMARVLASMEVAGCTGCKDRSSMFAMMWCHMELWHYHHALNLAAEQARSTSH